VLFRHTKLHSPQDTPASNDVATAATENTTAAAAASTPKTLEPPLPALTYSHHDRRITHHDSPVPDFNQFPSPHTSAGIAPTTNSSSDFRNMSLPSISAAYDPVRQSYTHYSSPAPSSTSFPRLPLPTPHDQVIPSLFSPNVDPALQNHHPNPPLPNPGMQTGFLPDALDTSFDFRGFQGSANDMLQYWLTQADNDVDFPMIPFPEVNLPFPDTTFAVNPSPAAHNTPSSRVRSDSGSVSSIPDSRFTRVEEVWREGTAKVAQFQTIWTDVAGSSSPNIFCCDRAVATTSSTEAGDSRWGLNMTIRNRLRAEFETPATTPAGSRLPPTQRLRSSAFPPPEVLDISLDIYFRRIHPIAPFVHLPTFAASSTPPSLLFTMCILGLSTMSQSAGGKFLKRAFLAVRLRALQELVTMATMSSSIEEKLCTFATAFLTLQLAALSSDVVLMAQSQALYSSLISIAQRHGLFSIGQMETHELLPDTPDVRKRWQAWARVESVKRLISCLVSADWWWGNSSCVNPLIRPETLELSLPADDDLFNAPSAEEWYRLVQSGRNVDLPAVRPRTFHLKECLDAILLVPYPLQAFSMFSLISTMKHMISDIHHRSFALVDDWIGLDRQVPWKTYQHDFRGRSLVPIVISLAQASTSPLRPQDINVMILWHNVNINLCANLQIFELAAGKNGAQRGPNALQDVAEWARTASARRACIHAAQTFKLLSNRKVSDSLMLNSMSALFHAALVLGLFLFQMPLEDVTPGGDTAAIARFDLMADVDWTMVCDSGLVDKPAANGGTIFEGAQRCAATDFVNFGGPISLNGMPSGGYLSARRVLMEYAHLMDEMGAWKPRTYSRILHIMSDVLEEVL